MAMAGAPRLLVVEYLRNSSRSMLAGALLTPTFFSLSFNDEESGCCDTSIAAACAAKYVSYVLGAPELVTSHLNGLSSV